MRTPLRSGLAGFLLAALPLGATLVHQDPTPSDRETPSETQPQPQPMQLGAFSVSLAVKDLAASLAFYEKLGFTKFAGNEEHHYLILRNGTAYVGLFQGMFDKNILTFNPGWTPDAKPLEGDFEDVRDIQARLEEAGLTLTTRADPDSDGPASLALLDPDGNPVLIDQHVPKPK